MKVEDGSNSLFHTLGLKNGHESLMTCSIKLNNEYASQQSLSRTKFDNGKISLYPTDNASELFSFSFTQRNR